MSVNAAADTRPVIALAMGDPAGISPELIALVRRAVTGTSSSTSRTLLPWTSRVEKRRSLAELLQRRIFAKL
jgi:4-hydroxy-L-threonine phosphate dehydrogenase PdxA